MYSEAFGEFRHGCEAGGFGFIVGGGVGFGNGFGELREVVGAVGGVKAFGKDDDVGSLGGSGGSEFSGAAKVGVFVRACRR